MDIMKLNLKSCIQDEEIKLHANLTAQCSQLHIKVKLFSCEYQ